MTTNQESIHGIRLTAKRSIKPVGIIIGIWASIAALFTANSIFQCFIIYFTLYFNISL